MRVACEIAVGSAGVPVTIGIGVKGPYQLFSLLLTKSLLHIPRCTSKSKVASSVISGGLQDRATENFLSWWRRERTPAEGLAISPDTPVTVVPFRLPWSPWLPEASLNTAARRHTCTRTVGNATFFQNTARTCSRTPGHAHLTKRSRGRCLLPNGSVACEFRGHLVSLRDPRLAERLSKLTRNCIKPSASAWKMAHGLSD